MALKFWLGSVIRTQECLSQRLYVSSYFYYIMIVKYWLDVFVAFIITDNLLLINSFFKIFKIWQIPKVEKDSFLE